MSKATQMIDEVIAKMGGSHPLDKMVYVGKSYSKADLITSLREIKEVLNETESTE